ncbi:MAG: ribosome-associated translation inhibitor RaiA [Bacteroidales bacterium]|nr:ribosome-associated translation inhibitor RaiA [Bacteroidales bacterium]MDP2235841.1 ribosome-associated translation inhibitor RaiA [Bacteroidales bacterium]
MKVNINAVHFKADQKLEAFITNKIEKLTSRYNDVLGSEVLLKLENTENPENKITEIKLLIKGNDLFASKQSKSFEEATDSAVEALKKQLEKHKAKFIK